MRNNESLLRMALRNGAKRVYIALLTPVAMAFAHLNASALEVNLGTANNYAVLAGQSIANSGLSVINGGNIGLSPNGLTSITGFPPGILVPPYIIQAANGATLQAQSDLTTAYNQAAGLAYNQNLTGNNLGGLTLTPGVYFFSSSAFLTGTLTLNDQGNPDAVFVFQIGSSLITAPNSSVVTINDPDKHPGISTFWQVGSSATLNPGTAFEGNIMALSSITADNGATDLDGRLLARNGSVILDDNTITAPPAEVAEVPDTGSTFGLLCSGLAAFFAFGRWFQSGSRQT